MSSGAAPTPDGRAAHRRDEPVPSPPERGEGARVWIYGASDDLIEVEGSCPGCDEYSGDDEHFLLIGAAGKARVRVWLTRRGIWAIAAAPVAEDVPMLPLAFQPLWSGYTARVVACGIEMVVHEAREANS